MFKERSSQLIMKEVDLMSRRFYIRQGHLLQILSRLNFKLHESYSQIRIIGCCSWCEFKLDLLAEFLKQEHFLIDFMRQRISIILQDNMNFLKQDQRQHYAYLQLFQHQYTYQYFPNQFHPVKQKLDYSSEFSLIINCYFV